MRITISGQHFELTPALVRAGVQGQQPEPIRQYWVDIDGTRWPVKQVIALATGEGRQRFISTSARRWLIALGFPVGQGSAVIPETEPQRPRRASSPKESKPSDRGPARRVEAADVVLIGCVKSKQEQGAPAKDLYDSDYFRKMRAYAEKSGRPWFILSAEHGLVHPDEWLEPYERYLPRTSRQYQRDWGQRVATQLELAVGTLQGRTFEVHAGSHYVDALTDPLHDRQAQVSDPLVGLPIGRRLSWYLNHEPATLGSAVEALSDPTGARSLTDVINSEGAGIKSPGMYSWWVDRAGAMDLSTGLGFTVEPGLIYSGLAGATRAGGATSSNTLWKRIALMHLGDRHQLSTLRWSLGSVLAQAYHQPAIDETDLTRWMYAHLKVVTVPVDDPDTLDELETGVLQELDPPLNLAKVGGNPLRWRLSELRKKYGSVTA